MGSSFVCNPLPNRPLSESKGAGMSRRRKRTDGKYWFISPHAWQYPCIECDDKHSVAFKRRRRGRPLSVCQDCVDRLELRPRISRDLKETGGKVNPVKVTFVDPATLTKD